FCTSVSGVALTAVKRPGAPPTLVLWLPLLFALIETTSKAGVCAETATTKRNGTSRRRISRPPAVRQRPAPRTEYTIAGMSTLKRSLTALAGALLFITAWLGVSGEAQQKPDPRPNVQAILRGYQTVTAARLKNPEPGNWLAIRRTYDGWGYSPLNQITTANVSQLRRVWNIPTGEGRVHEAAPVVNNGVMFITTPNNQVLALNATTGDVLWRYKRPRPSGAFVLHDTNRGVALYGDKVFFAAGEAVLTALDVRTGKEVWTKVVADNKSAYYLTLAPLVADNKVMIGASGGEFGVRGFVAAFDPDSGKEL